MNPIVDATTTAWPAFVQGLALSFGLIVAIGAQNAFVLRQGLRREHVGTVVLFCGAADAVLIAVGVFGMARLLGDIPAMADALAIAGASFLILYGWKALQRMRLPGELRSDVGGGSVRQSAVVAQATAFTFLNPHVYLDTVLLVGTIGAQHPPPLQAWFVLGASTASMAWFGTLGLGARWLAPWFAKPRAWQLLDGVIGITMWVLAALLIRHVLIGH